MSQQLANFVWGIADQIRGVYKPAQYGQVILPFTVLRRMECVMNGHRPELIELAAKVPNEQALGGEAAPRLRPALLEHLVVDVEVAAR